MKKEPNEIETGLKGFVRWLVVVILLAVIGLGMLDGAVQYWSAVPSPALSGE